MRKLYKLDGGIPLLPPQSIILDTGETIINFNLIADQYGYKELISEIEPDYNERFQRLNPVYEETETNIIKKWEVVNTISLDEYKEQKIDLLDEKYKNTVASEFTSQGYVFNFSKFAQDDFTQATAMFNLFPERVDTPWKTKNMGIILLTKEQYKQALLDAETHKLSLLSKFWNLEHSVDMCQSYAEVDAISWE